MGLPVIHLQISSEAWEKLNRDVWSSEYVPASLTDGECVESTQIRFRGGHTRNYLKKSYELKRSTKTLHLNAEYDDPSMIRNALSFRFFEWIGVPSPSTRHCVLLLNGQSLGVYLEIEAVERLFFERRHLPCTTLMYAGNDDANFSLFIPETKKLKNSLFDGYELLIGNLADQRRLEDFIFNVNTLQSRKLFEYLQYHLNIENYLKWIAGAVCTGNYDGFTNNYAIFQCEPMQEYRMIPWDYEGSWGKDCYGKLCPADSVRVAGYNILTKKVLAYPRFKRQYQAILTEILQSSFTETLVISEAEQMMRSIRSELEADATRKYSIYTFDKELDVIRSYTQQRRKWLLLKLKSL